jgi:hypothetical protein
MTVVWQPARSRNASASACASCPVTPGTCTLFAACAYAAITLVLSPVGPRGDRTHLVHATCARAGGQAAR